MERANKITSYRKAQPSLHRMVVRHSEPHTAHSFLPPDRAYKSLSKMGAGWLQQVVTHGVHKLCHEEGLGISMDYARCYAF